MKKVNCTILGILCIIRSSIVPITKIKIISKKRFSLLFFLQSCLNSLINRSSRDQRSLIIHAQLSMKRKSILIIVSTQHGLTLIYKAHLRYTIAVPKLGINQAELLMCLFISFFPAASIACDYLVD